MKKGTLHNICFVLFKTWKYERSIIIIIVLQVIITVFVPLIGIYLPSVVLNGIIGITDMKALIMKIASLLFVLFACNCTNAYITSIYETHLLNNKIHFLTDLFRKKMELDYAFIESAAGQNMYQYAMTTLLNDNQGVSGMLSVIGSLLGNACGLLLYTSIIASFDFKLMIVLILNSSIHCIILRILLSKQHSKKDKGITLDRKINYLFAFVSDERNNKDIKMYSMQDWLSKVADILINDRLLWIRKLAQYNFYAAVLDIVLLIIRDGLAYFSIFWSIFNNKIDISEFVFYFGAITGFSVFMTGLTSDFAYISQKSREVSALNEYLKIDNFSSSSRKEYLQPSVPLCIEFINVSFRYEEDDRFILRNINLKIEKGEKIALVGENGAGKTTLVKLLCGFYKPSEGKIVINGVEMSKISQTCVGNLFAAVFQDIHIIPASIAENIAFGDVNGKKEEIGQCIKIAGLDDLFGNIDTPVTKILHKEGVILSGGQEQKMMLARAAYKILYKNASALILDEPTAALDPIAERNFYERFNTFADGKTSVFISHRLASTQFCDRIIVLDSGKIVESATHRQLIKSEGRYKELFDIQTRYYN